MKFLTLIEIEIKKILPWLISLFIGITAISTFSFYRDLHNVKDELLPQLMSSTVEEYVKSNGTISLAKVFDYGNLPLIFIFAAILLVCLGLYLWYKEWIGTSKRIYMLLSLKGQRFSIYLSKLFVIVFSVFCFYAVILLNIGIGALLIQNILPDGIFDQNLVQGVLTQSNYIGMILPLTITDFLYKTAFVILMFSLISVFVLSDRSKRIIGFICGTIYGLANVALFVYTKSIFLFTDERFIINWSFVLGASMLSILISTYLLNKKISI